MTSMPQIKLIEASVKRSIRKLIKQMGTLNVKDISQLCANVTYDQNAQKKRN